MKHENMITVTAEIPEEFLEDWRVFVVTRGGRVLMPRSKQEKEHPSDWLNAEIPGGIKNERDKRSI